MAAAVDKHGNFLWYVFYGWVVNRTYIKGSNSKWVHSGMLEDIPQGLAHFIADKFLKNRITKNSV